MIYLFDNCYLSTTNQIVETCKHVWIGEHQKLDDPFLHRTYDIYKSYKSITTKQLNTLLKDIHSKFSDTKVVIYCDVKYYHLVYSAFFGSFMTEEGLRELYTHDRTKENYNIGSKLYGMGVTGFKNVEHVVLPEELQVASPVSFTPDCIRIEVAFANYVAGNQDYKQYCIDRVCAMYKGSTGHFSSYIEQNIPAMMEDSDYTITNILSDKYIKTIVDQYETDEILPRSILPLLQEQFGYNHFEHFSNIINSNNIDKDEQERLSADVCYLPKEEYVEKYIINPERAITFQLVFPNISNFDSINPILWNKILKNHDDAAWLSKFEVNYGTNNQTDGTV